MKMFLLFILHLFLFFFVVFISGLAVQANNERWNNEKLLLNHLMEDYDLNVRPVLRASDAVIIQLGITLTQIFDLDEKNQVLTTNVWLDQEWRDEYLTWDPALFDNISRIRIPCELIWKPDIVLYNNADDYTQGYMNSRAMVGFDGNVFWPPPTKFRSTCPVDVTYFPFDDQTCIMKLGSWIYDGWQVDVMNRTSEVDLSNYVPNGEWQLLEGRVIRNVVYYPCCDEPFPDVTIKLVIRRKTLYYMYNMVMPCMMMSTLTLLVFCLPPDSGEKIALGVTVLLAFSVFMLAIAEKMPETSESIPLLGIYLTSVMAITSISVVMTVVVMNFHYRGPNRKEVPECLRSLFLKKVTKELCKKTTMSNSTWNCSNVYIAKETENTFWRKNDEKQDVEGTFESTDIPGSNIDSIPFSQQYCFNILKTQNEILKLLQQLIFKKDQDDRQKRDINEWRQVALSIDRLLFWIFFFITLSSSLCFLVIIPVYRRSM